MKIYLIRHGRQSSKLCNVNVDLSEEGLEAICEALSEMGPDRIVITGLQQGDLIFNYIFEKDKTSELLSTRKIGGDRSGTGDVFSSIVTGLPKIFFTSL